jgi:predicted permease
MLFIHWPSLFRRGKFESDMSDEFAFHIEARTRDLVAKGLSPEEGARTARLEFGAVPRYSDECRTSHRLHWADDAIHDFRYAARALRRSPGFTATALISLTLGIGLNVAVFSIFESLLLRSMPVYHPSEVVFVERSSGISHSFPAYRDLRDNTRAFAGLAGYRIAPMNLDVSAGHPERIWGYLATGNYFDLLGVKPVVGRFFHQEDDLHPGASPYAVISYTAWHSRFAGDPGIVGRQIRINGHSFTILGVAPRAFHGTEIFYWPDIWVPMMMQPQIEPSNHWLETRDTWNTWIVGRLKPNVSGKQAIADLDRVAADMARRFPNSYSGIHMKLSKPGLAGSFMRQPVRLFTSGLVLLVSLVLLTACANLASLMLARAADRSREIAIRASVGASRARLIRQVLTEAFLLSALGGLLGCIFALGVCHLASQWRAPIDLPVQLDVQPDWTALLVATALSLVAGLLFGLAPAVYLSRTDVNALIKGDSGVPLHRSRFRLPVRDLLVTVEIALSVVLVFASFSALRGLRSALTLPLGFDPANVTTAAFDLALAGYNQPQGRLFQDRVLAALKQLPDVTAAAYSNSLPLSIDQSSTVVRAEEETSKNWQHATTATYYQVSPRFMSTMGIRLLAGRDFTAHDDEHAPLVAIVNSQFAQQVMNTAAPVGKRFRHGFGTTLVQVVGLVGDGKYESLTESPRPVVFWPMAQDYNPTTTFVVRSPLPSGDVVASLRSIIHSIDNRIPVYGTGSLETMLGLALFPMRTAAVALTSFGIMALMLAMTGINGLVAYSISRRRHEIGIRLAVGASSFQVLRVMVARFAALTLFGSIIGIVLSVFAGAVLRSVVLGMSGTDVTLLAAVLLILITAAVISCIRPALNVLRTDASTALRYN